jgi:ferredoxin--NADP+ reductase
MSKKMNENKPGHFIAIFGGAVAGAEAAGELSRRGIHTVIFDQNALPYGKLETGLPKWHNKLRDQQESRIDENIRHPLVSFVPLLRLGQHLSIQHLIDDFGFSAILLATGAWSDRPLPIAGIDAYVGRGLIYQNPLVRWFNLNHDRRFSEEHIAIPDNTMIIGGGLASLDVAKIVTIESTRQALAQRGIQRNALELESKGIYKVLAEAGVSLSELGLKGCRLFTRNSIDSMPLTPIADNADSDALRKAAKARQKIIDVLQAKFPIEVITQKSPVEKIVEDGHLTGIVFCDTEEVNGRFHAVTGSERDYRAPLIVSAIGSIPEPLDRIPQKGEVWAVEDVDTGKIKGFDNVFALGNAVTGRGNIRQSLRHSRQVSENIVDQYLVWRDRDYREIFTAAEARAEKRTQAIMEAILTRAPLTAIEVERIYNKIKVLQRERGYVDYDNWIAMHIPQRLEAMALSGS